MIKIAISGKANSGKDTTARYLHQCLEQKYNNVLKLQKLALADPIKEMVLLMFPHAKKECLYGASSLREEVIPYAKDFEGNPLTYRQALIDLGTNFGRRYDSLVWVRNLAARLENVSADVVITTDARFINEFKFLKEQGFVLIRVLRNSYRKINNISELEQDQIPNQDFDFVIDNNSTLENLSLECLKITRYL